MLTPSELAAMRRTVSVDTLTALATVQTPTSTPDGQGGMRTTWSDATNIPCRLAPERLGAGQVTAGGSTEMACCERCGSAMLEREPDHSGDVRCRWCGCQMYAAPWRLSQRQAIAERATQYPDHRAMAWRPLGPEEQLELFEVSPNGW